MHKLTTSAAISYPHTLNLSSAQLENQKEILILLHGFNQNGEFMLKRFQKHFDQKKYFIIAPDGPFYLPQKKKDDWEVGHAWYFYDAKTKKFLIDFDPPADWLAQIVRSFGAKELPISIIGYSQGGFLAPKLGEKLQNIKQIIGINCIFRGEKFSPQKQIRYTQIHGVDDNIVSVHESFESFEKIELSLKMKSFLKIEGSGHFLNEKLIQESVKAVKTLTR